VYVNPPFGGAKQSLKYPARYTDRVAISNERIESLEDGQITFRYKDYAHGHRWWRMTLTAHEFLRRFMQHVLALGFVRIRRFALLSHRGREEQLAVCRRLLGVAETDTVARNGEVIESSTAEAEITHCPVCGQGTLRIVCRIPQPRLSELVASTYQRRLLDSS
jgi:hypothetical protein